MQPKARIIVVTAVCTTLFWGAVIVGFFWIASNGGPGARVRFASPGEMDVFSGAYRVEVITSNNAAASLLLSHTARAPERVSFTLERLETNAAPQ